MLGTSGNVVVRSHKDHNSVRGHTSDSNANHELGDIRWLGVDLPRDGNRLPEVVLLRNLRITECKLVSLRNGDS